MQINKIGQEHSILHLPVIISSYNSKMLRELELVLTYSESDCIKLFLELRVFQKSLVVEKREIFSKEPRNNSSIFKSKSYKLIIILVISSWNLRKKF